jgi:hypothetical protein
MSLYVFLRGRGSIMFKLYFSSVTAIISTILIVGFAILFSLVNMKRISINHWGVLVICIFFLGLLMSIMSGLKDNINTAAAAIPANSWLMTVLSILGVLAFIVGIAAIIIRKQNVWQVEFYVLSAIILVKTVVVEVYRVITYIKGLW